MKALLINQCSDRMYWYRNLVGCFVPYVREYPECYMSREPAGYANIVQFHDATIVEVEPDQLYKMTQ